MRNILPSAPYLLERFHYDDGVLYWRNQPPINANRVGWNTRYGDKPAGRIDNLGYIRLELDGVDYRAHRIIWKMVHGFEPPDALDHIDGDKLNNRIENLRGATHSQNQMNKRCHRSNKSGFKGIFAHHAKSHQAWQAQIKANRKTYCLGTFRTPELAHAAYCRAAKLLHRDYARTS